MNRDATANLRQQLANASSLAAKQDTIIWAVFSVFTAASGGLLVALLSDGQSAAPTKGMVLCAAGFVLSLVWAAILERAVAYFGKYERIIRSLEHRLSIPSSVSVARRVPGPSTRRFMIHCVFAAALVWLIGLFVCAAAAVPATGPDSFESVSRETTTIATPRARPESLGAAALVRLVLSPDRAGREAPAWALAMITAVAAVLAGILAQWFRVHLDEARERERVRRLLVGEVAGLRERLDHLVRLAHAWQLPDAPHFWHMIDTMMRGYDESRTKTMLLPGVVAALTHAFFLKVRSLRLGAEGLASDYARERRTNAEVVVRYWNRPAFEFVEKRASEAVDDCEALFAALHASAPRHSWTRWIAGVERGALAAERRMWDAQRGVSG